MSFALQVNEESHLIIELESFGALNFFGKKSRELWNLKKLL